MSVVITKDNFEELVLKSDKPVLVDFWATWCGPCRMLAPVLEEIAEEYADKIVVGKINVDEEMELAQQFRISAIPTILCFANGQLVAQNVGFVPKKTLENMIPKA